MVIYTRHVIGNTALVPIKQFSLTLVTHVDDIASLRDLHWSE